MKKVVYSISKPNKLEESRLTGFGCITDEDLIIAAISKNGKPYIKVFEDCLKNCHPIPYKPDENKGEYYEIFEIDGKDIQVDYSIWYKIQK